MAEEFAFAAGDYVVYPTHGVGKVLGVETREIAEQNLQLFVISFDRDRMTLRVPVSKVDTAGLRKLSTQKVMENALTTLKGRARVKRTMWSRRAQEYEAKINSGILFPSPRSSATCIPTWVSPTSPSASARSTRPPSIVWPVKSPPWNASARKRRR